MSGGEKNIIFIAQLGERNDTIDTQCSQEKICVNESTQRAHTSAKACYNKSMGKSDYLFLHPHGDPDQS